MGGLISVAVIDDQPIFRAGISSVISNDNSCQLVAQGGNYDDVVSIVNSHRPDVVLLDFHVPGGGIKALKEVRQIIPTTKTVMFSTEQCEAELLQSLDAGAHGYLLKGVQGDHLIQVVKTVHQGSLYTDPSFAAELLARKYKKRIETESIFASLTMRERDILCLVTEGFTNKEIARSFEIAEKTVKHYMTTVLQKLQVRNRVEAALIARKVMETELSEHRSSRTSCENETLISQPISAGASM